VAGVAALAIGLVPIVAMAKDGVESLWVWRRTGGRYDDRGGLIRSHIDLLTVFEQVLLPRTQRGTPIDVHPSAQWGWEFQWTYQGVGNKADAPAVGAPGIAAHPLWVARASGLTAAEQQRIAEGAHVVVYGDAWVVDQREAPAPLEAHSLGEREPGPLEWLYYGGTEPMRIVGAAADPWLTWEWRVHLGQRADPPTGEPRTLDEMRIAHNVAIAAGDAAAAEHWLRAIQGELDAAPATAFTRGVRLLGVRVTGGVQPRVESWFERSSDEPIGEASFDVRSTVEARAPWSLVPPDPTDREMAFPPSLPTKLWRPSFIYRTEAVLNHRIGRERYWGEWRARDSGAVPVRLDGQRHTTLAVVR
jgi:hypothetical protein